MRMRITKLRPTAVIPAYATARSAAFDLTAAETTIVPARGQGLIPTGLSFGIPENHVLHIFSRSSTFSKLGLMLSNGVGVIDADFGGPEDEVKVMMFNPGDVPVTVPAGTRIAQGMVYPRPRVEFEEGEAGALSRGGIGSTGGYQNP